MQENQDLTLVGTSPTDKWQEILQDWRASNLGVAAYCRKIEVPAWKFHYWKKRLLGEGAKASGGFVRVKFSGGSERDSGLSIECAEGLLLRLDCGFDPVELLRVLNVLRGQKC